MTTQIVYKKYFSFVIIFISMILFSCNEKFTVQPESFSEKIVVESYILTNTDSVSIFITHSVSPYIQTEGYDSSRLIHNANVKITAENDVFLFAEDNSKCYNYNGTHQIARRESNYFAKNINFLKYKKCTLEVKKDSKKIFAESEIPSQTKINNIEAVLKRDKNSKGPNYSTDIILKIDGEFPINTKSYYRIIFFCDHYDNGQIYTLGNKYTNYFIINTDTSVVNFTFHAGNIHEKLEWRNSKIYLEHITENYYNFREACQTQYENDDSIFNQDGTEIPSNIQGGFGIFTFIARDTACINIKKSE